MYVLSPPFYEQCRLSFWMLVQECGSLTDGAPPSTVIVFIDCIARELALLMHRLNTYGGRKEMGICISLLVEVLKHNTYR